MTDPTPARPADAACPWCTNPDRPDAPLDSLCETHQIDAMFSSLKGREP